jgi:hypothetical protein
VPETTRDTVALSVPAAARYLRLIRMTAAAFAAELDLSLRDVEDLRTAVDELCAVAISGAKGTETIQLELREDGGGVRVGGTCARADAPEELDPIAAGLLELLADEASFRRTADGCAFDLLRRPRA